MKLKTDNLYIRVYTHEHDDLDFPIIEPRQIYEIFIVEKKDFYDADSKFILVLCTAGDYILIEDNQKDDDDDPDYKESAIIRRFVSSGVNAESSYIKLYKDLQNSYVMEDDQNGIWQHTDMLILTTYYYKFLSNIVDLKGYE